MLVFFKALNSNKRICYNNTTKIGYRKTFHPFEKSRMWSVNIEISFSLYLNKNTSKLNQIYIEEYL